MSEIPILLAPFFCFFFRNTNKIEKAVVKADRAIASVKAKPEVT